MENQPDQQQETHGKTTNDINNQDKEQANNQKLLRRDTKAGTATSSPKY